MLKYFKIGLKSPFLRKTPLRHVATSYAGRGKQPGCIRALSRVLGPHRATQHKHQHSYKACILHT